MVFSARARPATATTCDSISSWQIFARAFMAMIGRLVLKDCSIKSNSHAFENTNTEFSELP